MVLRRLLVLFLLVPGVIAAATSPAWAAAYDGGSVRDGMRWSLFLGTGIGVLLLVIFGEMWWLGRQDAVSDGSASLRGTELSGSASLRGTELSGSASLRGKTPGNR